MLPTDTGKPGPTVLARIADSRVRQFWDPNHTVAALLKNLHPRCCVRNGFLWDIAAVYAPGAQWSDIPQEPVFVKGPVVKNSAELASVIARP